MKKRKMLFIWVTISILLTVGIFVFLIVVPIITTNSILSTSDPAAANNQIGTFKQALEIYRLNCGSYPTEKQGLAALVKKPTIKPVCNGWRGPYIDRDVPKGPWGHEYKYIVPGPAGDPYGIISYGADGIEGGDGDNKNITSWQ